MKRLLLVLLLVVALLVAFVAPAMAKTKHKASYRLYSVDGDRYQFSTSPSYTGRVVKLVRGRTYTFTTNVPNTRDCSVNGLGHEECSGFTAIKGSKYSYRLGHSRKIKWRGPTGKYQFVISSADDVGKPQLTIRW